MIDTKELGRERKDILLYTIEITPNQTLYPKVPTLNVETDYEQWKNRVFEEIQSFYRFESEIHIKKIFHYIISCVNEAKCELITIELKGMTFRTLVTNQLTAPQFQKIISRHSPNIFLCMKQKKLDERMVLFHWLEMENFQVDTFRYVMYRITLQDYSFFNQGSYLDMGMTNTVEHSAKAFMKVETGAKVRLKTLSHNYERDLLENKWVLPQDRLAFLHFKNMLKESNIKANVSELQLKPDFCYAKKVQH